MYYFTYIILLLSVVHYSQPQSWKLSSCLLGHDFQHISKPTVSLLEYLSLMLGGQQGAQDSSHLICSKSFSYSEKMQCIINDICGTRFPMSLFHGNSISAMEVSFPSGVLVDSFNHENKVLRIIRLDHSVISIREKWISPHLVDDIFSSRECLEIIQRAETFARDRGGWSLTPHINWRTHPTIDVKINAIFDEDHWSRNDALFQKRLFPAYTMAYGINGSRLRVSDLFVTKYNASDPQSSYLDGHRDKTPWSFVIPLNLDYLGGGTLFYGLDELWKPETVGSALIFHGKHMHGALPTTSGVRYILAGFCDYLDSNHRVSMESFLSEYDPQHDGYAAAEGFQTGDIIRGIKSCLPTESDDMFAVKEFMMSTDDLSDDDWKRYATSCEVAAPKSKTVFLVERNPNAI